MLSYLLLLSFLLALPLSAFAQLTERGDRLVVRKGTKLCADVQMEKEKGVVNPGRVFWRVTSHVRSNGTQTVASYIREKVYDSKSGDTRITESVYQEDYATYFKTDPEHKGMLLMISPQDDRVEATVAVCENKR